MKYKNLANLFFRYFILVLVAIPNLYLFYLILTPLTVYPVYFLLNIFFNVSLSSNIISLNGNSLIEIIPSCVAGAAYYLLLVLNLSVPKIDLKKRLQMVSGSFLALLLINILRIFFLSLLVIYSASYFDVAHKIFWYLLSTIFVVAIWFAEVKYFKVKDIPIYTDIKYLLKQIK